MQRLFVFFAFLLSCASCFSQPMFDARYQVPDYAVRPRMMVEATQGGYLTLAILTDTIHPYYSGNAMFLHSYNAVIKTNAGGDMEWISCFNDPTLTIQNYSYNRMIATQDSGVAMVGFNGSGYLLLTHLDKNGQLLFARRIRLSGQSGDAGDLVQTASGNYVFCSTWSGSAFHQPVLVCYDAQGTLLWNKTYDFSINSGSIAPQSKVLELPGGNLLLSFSLYTGGNPIICTDSLGNVIWKKGYTVNYTSTSDWSRTVDMSLDTSSHRFVTVDIFQTGILVKKCDYSGNITWEKTYFDSTRFAGLIPDHIDVSPDHGLLISGIGIYSTAYGGNSPPRERMFIMKTDSNGVFQWFHYLPVFAQDEIRFFLMANYTDNGDIILCGQDTSSGYSPMSVNYFPIYSALMARLSPQGEYFCDQVIFTGTQPVPGYSSFNYNICTVSSPVNDTVSSFYQFFVPPGTKTVCDGQAESVAEMSSSQADIFPNPANNSVIFHRDENFHAATFDLFDANGELVFRRENYSGNDLLLDVSGFAEGIYFYRLTDSSGTTSGKIAVVH